MAVEVVGPELTEPRVPAVDAGTTKATAIGGRLILLAVAQQQRRAEAEEILVEAWNRERERERNFRIKSRKKKEVHACMHAELNPTRNFCHLGLAALKAILVFLHC